VTGIKQCCWNPEKQGRCHSNKNDGSGFHGISMSSLKKKYQNKTLTFASNKYSVHCALILSIWLHHVFGLYTQQQVTVLYSQIWN